MSKSPSKDLSEFLSKQEANSKMIPKQESHVHHMIKLVSEHNHHTFVGKDGTTQKKPSNGKNGKRTKIISSPSDAGKNSKALMTEVDRSMIVGKDILR